MYDPDVVNTAVKFGSHICSRITNYVIFHYEKLLYIKETSYGKYILYIIRGRKTVCHGPCTMCTHMRIYLQYAKDNSNNLSSDICIVDDSPIYFRKGQNEIWNKINVSHSPVCGAYKTHCRRSKHYDGRSIRTEKTLYMYMYYIYIYVYIISRELQISVKYTQYSWS